jgi:RND superfamily putative drug exporter
MGRGQPARAGALERWARFSCRRAGWIVLSWVAFLAAVVLVSRSAGGELADNFSLPGAEAQRGVDLLKQRFPSQAGDSAVIVFVADDGFESEAIRSRIEAVLADVAALPPVVAVESPYERPAYISASGTIARAVVHWNARAIEADKAEVEHFIEVAEGASGDGLRIEAGGRIVEAAERVELSSEVIGLMAAVVILLVAFGSVVAMGLPIGSALFGIGAAVSIVLALARFIDFPEFTAQFIAMIGIGVGIDYCLLVVTRFREGLHHGKSVEESVVLAVTTSGRSVIFAGAVVTIAFFGLFLMGLPFIAAVGFGTAIAVVLAVSVAVTLLPAVLSLLGHRVDALKVPFLHSTEGVDPASGWYRLAKAIQRRPLPFATAGTAVLLTLSAPVLWLDMGFTDAGNNPKSWHTRQAYDLLTEGFGPGFNGPIIVAIDTAGGGAERVEALRTAIAATPNVAGVQPALQSPAGDTAVITLFAGTAPQDNATTGLVHVLRDRVIPETLEGSGAQAFVTGAVASNIDIEDRISERMPFLFIGVIGLSFILLTAVFRSIAVAAKAAVMNLLSIGAAYGVVVAVFQWGWGSNPLGAAAGPIEVFLPMMFFTILFGLSMDYEVFLISRIREIYARTGDNATAVAEGLAATARVITAAAAIMCAVFLAFVLGDNRVIKQVGIGLATAIFVDATIVRLILVPATMELLGRWNWWLPSWLDRLLPEFHVEGPGPIAAAEPAGVPAGGR